MPGWSRSRGWRRGSAAVLVGGFAWFLGIGSVLSFNLWSGEEYQLFGKTLFDLKDFLASNIMLPLGGLLIALFVALWRRAAYGARGTGDQAVSGCSTPGGCDHSLRCAGWYCDRVSQLDRGVLVGQWSRNRRWCLIRPRRCSTWWPMSSSYKDFLPWCSNSRRFRESENRAVRLDRGLSPRYHPGLFDLQ